MNITNDTKSYLILLAKSILLRKHCRISCSECLPAGKIGLTAVFMSFTYGYVVFDMEA